MVNLSIGEAGRRVGDQRDAEHLSTQVSGGNYFKHRGHSDQIGALPGEHANLGWRLESPAHQARIYALRQCRVDLSSQIA